MKYVRAHTPSVGALRLVSTGAGPLQISTENAPGFQRQLTRTAAYN